LGDRDDGLGRRGAFAGRSARPVSSPSPCCYRRERRLQAPTNRKLRCVAVKCSRAVEYAPPLEVALRIRENPTFFRHRSVSPNRTPRPSSIPTRRPKVITSPRLHALLSKRIDDALSPSLLLEASCHTYFPFEGALSPFTTCLSRRVYHRVPVHIQCFIYVLGPASRGRTGRQDVPFLPTYPSPPPTPTPNANALENVPSPQL
jgi:hypothetical protein